MTPDRGSRDLIAEDQLRALERALEHAFATGDDSGLDVLGYGEVSSVIAWTGVHGEVACKRLPVFPDRHRLEAYQATLDTYIERLARTGIDVVDTRVYTVATSTGKLAAYCVQPALPRHTLGPRLFADHASRAPGAPDVWDVRDVWDALLDRIFACVGPTLGLDGQLSNWAVTHTPDGPEIAYLDISTPLMRDEDGRELLDTDLFLSSLPWVLRPVVKRFMLKGILATYYDPRAVIVDFLGNLYKERLAKLLPDLLERANRRLAGTIDRANHRAIDAREVERYYRSDARTWELLQRLRRMDRAWQHKVRRRPYPFLLPGPIER